MTDKTPKLTDKIPKCGLCGEPMPPGEEMFKYHGYSGPCPAEPKTPKSIDVSAFDYNRDLDIISLVLEKEGDESLLDRVKRIRALCKSARAHSDGWRDISTAPKDGTPFIGYSPSHGVKGDVRWSHERQDFDLNGWSSLKRDWTKWQPPLAAPTHSDEIPEGYGDFNVT